LLVGTGDSDTKSSPDWVQPQSGKGVSGVLPQPLLKTMIKLDGLLKEIDEGWAVGGDAGEIVQGVNVTADHLEILTTKKGCSEIDAVLEPYRMLAPKETEKTLDKASIVEGNPLPVCVKSEYAEYSVEQVRVEVYGDMRIKVGERDWSDPLQFTPTTVNLVGRLLPLVPLELVDRVYRYLGDNWSDRVRKISEAVKKKRGV